MKKILSIILVLTTLFSFSSVSFAEEAAPAASGTFTMLDYNVHGLLGKECGPNSLYIGGVFNDYDIVCVQEDFNYHIKLNKNLDLPYNTKHSGFSGVGDGMNVYSKFPVYNQQRTKWNDLFGVLPDGDELTPKGILYTVIELQKGVYVDVYDIHADAFDNEGSREARKSNYTQLAQLITEKSVNNGRAYIVTGDFNYYLYDYTDLYTYFMQPLGCTDAYSKVVLGTEIPDHSVPYKWGESNSVERFFYKSSDSLKLEATTHDYIDFKNPDTGLSCSDHNACKVTFTYEAAELENDIEIEKYSYINEFARRFTTFFKELYILIDFAIGFLVEKITAA